MTSAPTSVLFIGARCGEEVVCAGGILRRFALQGARVTIVALSRRLTTALALGASAWESPSPVALQASAKLLGAVRVELLDMPEPPLGPACRVALQAQLAALIRVERPQAVLSHGPALRTAAVDRRAAVALVDGAIAAAAATETSGQQAGAPDVPSHEVRERWFFVAHDAAARTRGRAAEDWGLTRTRGDWHVFDATTTRDLKWRALRGYLAAPPIDPPAELARLLAEERFLRVVNPVLSRPRESIVGAVPAAAAAFPRGRGVAMPDRALRYRHRSESWRERLIAGIALLREADRRDRRVLHAVSRLAALAEAQQVVSGASDIASARGAIVRLRDLTLRSAPPSEEPAGAARARAFDAVLGQIDAIPTPPAGGPEPAPPNAA